jgi:Domain of unknown function (DUF4371)
VVCAKDSDVTGNVLNKVDLQHKEAVTHNREAVASLIRAVLFCARQSIATRGHRESKHAANDDGMNHGNFTELCDLLELENPEMARKSHRLPTNATYMSKKAQEDFLQAIAAVIQQQIVHEVEDAGMYALIVDEARDNSCTECIRYYQKTECKIVERFLGFVLLNALSAEAFTTTILDFLAHIGLDVKKCIVQSYDGASVMSGVNNGVQKLIRDASRNPCPYIHCHAHRVNLVLAYEAKRVDLVAYTVGLLDATYSFQSVSTVCHRRLVAFSGTAKIMKSSYFQFLNRVIIDGYASMLEFGISIIV